MDSIYSLAEIYTAKRLNIDRGNQKTQQKFANTLWPYQYKPEKLLDDLLRIYF